MTYQFTVSPDFGPDVISAWYIFNTWMQHTLGDAMHLELYDNFAAQRDAIDAGKVDLIYANPFDAAMLVRDKGFVPLVRPVGAADEAVLAVAADSDYDTVEDLRPGARVACTDDPDIRMIGMIMLEPADLNASNIEVVEAGNYVLIAKALMGGKADVGVFYHKAFDGMSALVQRSLRPLVRSEISVIHHTLMAGPALADRRRGLTDHLCSMANDPKGRGVLESLGMEGWAPVEDEEAEFMIDLMATLTTA